MSEQNEESLLDRLVEGLATAMDAVGLNGRRVRWRWHQKRRDLGEAGARGEQMLRSARGKHKMCPECRALVERSVTTCPECEASLSGVRAPGVSRTLSNMLPSITRATPVILLVNGLVFLLLLLTPNPDSAGGSVSFSFGSNLLLRYGAGSGYLVRFDGEWFRLFTSIFLHGSLLHFGFNSFVLMQLGPLCEDLYGAAKFWVIYLFAGVSGNLAAQLLSTSPVVGASGSILGLIGVLLGYDLRTRRLDDHLRNMARMYAVLMMVFSLLPGISFLSHAGGLAGGFIAGLAIPAGSGRERERGIWGALAVGSIAVVLWAFYEVSVHGTDFLRYVE